MNRSKQWYIKVFGAKEGKERYKIQQQNRYVPMLKKYREHKLKNLFK